jgi:hypothetical protein
VADKNKTHRIIIKGIDRTADVQSWRYIGEKCEVAFSNGGTFTYSAGNVQIVESVLNVQKSRDCFEYLKRVADVTGLIVTSDSGEKFNTLASNYAKIDFVRPDCILGAFLGGKLPETDGGFCANPVFPFGFNASQKIGVDNALSIPLSVIEGPPGTGKTQTILNIIANAVMRGQSVAVVSGNNSATANVLEKLPKYGVGFIAAYLGNSENKKEFINSQRPMPEISEWANNRETERRLTEETSRMYAGIESMLVKKNRLSELKQELSSLRTEQKHFILYSAEILTPSNTQISQIADTAAGALEMWLLCETY